MGLVDPVPAAGRPAAVLCIPDARWLRWSGGTLAVGDRSGQVRTLPVSARELMLVGRTFAGLAPCVGGENRVAVAARFASGATVLIDRRAGRCAVAASPPPRPRPARSAAVTAG